MTQNETENLARDLAELALSKNAREVCIMDLQGISSVADFFVICHGDADVHVRAIADAVIRGARDMGQRVWHKEAGRDARWVLLDFVDVVVHVFDEETREFYGLERLWGDAETEEIIDNA